MRGNRATVHAVVLLALLAAPAPVVAASGDLRAGVGKADVTPPQTGYYLGGWTRADRLALGQHTRLFAKAMVLERDGRKVALVALELFAIPAGLLKHAAEMVADRGFDERNVLISVTHTHSGPGGFANYPTYNFRAPSVETINDPASFAQLVRQEPADRQLYTFLARQIASAIRRADTDLGRAVAGWGEERIAGLTRNRSVEAHLADHGIEKAFGTGSPRDDPDGEVHTVDPAVDVLRVDKLVRGRRVPIGAWSNFANHGTVTKADLQAYDGDHHAAAHRVFEQNVRAAGRVPSRQLVVNVYGNANEGDLTAGIDYSGPAGADHVGRVEAAAMLRAWRQAGRRLSRRPVLDLRWTRACFCGAKVEGGRVADRAMPGVPFFTGSEEGRGPLFDVTHTPFEGLRSPTGFDSQGHKIGVPLGEFPKAVPLMVVRIGDRVIASMPGEPTKEVGARVKAAVLAASRAAGVRRVVIAGLANEYLSYITTPEEYDRQHYEGGSTLYGPFESVFLTQRLTDLAHRLARDEPAPDPYEFDPTNGVRPDGPPYPAGASAGRLLTQPEHEVERLGHARIAWQGGPDGHDRPVDTAFVVVERRISSRWRVVDSDLGLAMLWRVGARGRYDAYWEPPRDAPATTYRLLVTATRYRLFSRPFRVTPSRALAIIARPAPPGRVAVSLAYPPAIENVDLTARPATVRGGAVTFLVADRAMIVRRRRGTVFSVAAPPGATVTIPPRGAVDRHGNTTATAIQVR
jgi:neutral ceramidase